MPVKAKRVIHLGFDGADPVYMKRLLDEGKLPNIQKLIDIGAVNETDGILGGMLGVVPTITPPCWTTMATGAYPETHGITCYWLHEPGKPLNQMEYGFDSRRIKAETIWDAYAREGMKSIVWHFCCAFPPTPGNDKVIIVDGTSPGTPMFTLNVDRERTYECFEGDFPIKIFPKEVHNDGADCLIEVEVKESIIAQIKDQELEIKHPVILPAKKGLIFDHMDGEDGQTSRTYERIVTPITIAEGWKSIPEGAKEVVLPVNKGEARRFGLLISEDGKTFTELRIYASKQDEKPLASCKLGEWTEMIRDSFRVNGTSTPVAYRFKFLQNDFEGNGIRIYMSFASNLADFHLYYPQSIGPELYEKIGPPIPQAACSKHDKILNEVLIEAWRDNLRWEIDCMKYLMENNEWNYLCCHLHQIDHLAHSWGRELAEARNPDYQYYREIYDRGYQLTDDVVGEFLGYLDGETAILLTSDHGIIASDYDNPLIGDPWGINVAIMKELGYTKVKEVNGTQEIDWENTTAVSQRSGYVYVNLKGRDPNGIVEEKDYEDLVTKIIDDLYNYRDPKTGKRIIAFALRNRDMYLVGLGGPKCGDIYFILEKDFCRVHGDSLPTFVSKDTSPMALFIIGGAGIKKGVRFARKVRQVDIVPTIAHLQGGPMPKDVDGAVIYQALEE